MGTLGVHMKGGSSLVCCWARRASTVDFCPALAALVRLVPSNRVISSLEGKFGTVGDTFVLVLEPLFMKISNLCKNHL